MTVDNTSESGQDCPNCGTSMNLHSIDATDPGQLATYYCPNCKAYATYRSSTKHRVKNPPYLAEIPGKK